MWTCSKSQARLTHLRGRFGAAKKPSGPPKSGPPATKPPAATDEGDPFAKVVDQDTCWAAFEEFIGDESKREQAWKDGVDKLGGDPDEYTADQWKKLAAEALPF